MGTNIVSEAFDYKGLSVRAFAAELGVAHGAMLEMRDGARAIPPWVAAKCAVMLGRPWAEGVAATGVDQGRSDAERQFWKECLRRMKDTAAASVVAVTILGASAPSMKSQAAENLTESAPVYTFCVYISE